MAARSKRLGLIIGALALVLCVSVVMIAGAGFVLLNWYARTATPSLLPTRVISPTFTVRPTATLTRGITPSVRPTKPVIPIPQDQATCLAQGGKWGRIGLAPQEQCNLPAPDAGHVCNDSSECTGLCLADLSAEEKERLRQRTPIPTSGQCSRWVIVVGCVAVVENGQVKAIVCRD